MAFPLIAPLPTFIPTLHPCIQAPVPVWSHPRDPGGRAGTDSQPWMGTDGSPRAGDLRATLAVPWHGQSTPGTLTWGAGNARCSPKHLLAPAQLLPTPLPPKRGFHSPPQGCARSRGLPWGPEHPHVCGGAPLLQQPLGTLEAGAPQLPRPRGCPWVALCPCSLPRHGVRVPVSELGNVTSPSRAHPHAATRAHPHTRDSACSRSQEGGSAPSSLPPEPLLHPWHPRTPHWGRG